MLNHLTTEQRNPDSEAIDALSALQIVELMNREDARVADAVGRQASRIVGLTDPSDDQLVTLTADDIPAVDDGPGHDDPG